MVPDDAVKLGAGRKRPSRPHADWTCEIRSGVCEKRSREAPLVEPYFWCPPCRWHVCGACCRTLADKPTAKQVAPWRPDECRVLDRLVAEMVKDFRLPDPNTGYTIKMNWYPDGASRVSAHRHDNWTLLLSLGAPRVLTIDRAEVCMDHGDCVLFGVQSHGVPMMPGADGRLSLVFMFEPLPCVQEAAREVCRGIRASRSGANARPPANNDVGFFKLTIVT